MADITHTRIDQIDSLNGIAGITLHRAANSLGVSSFGISIIDLAPGASDYPEHDHSPDGIGGQMFAERPGQLGQEEVYAALEGFGMLEADGEQYPLDADHIVRVGPEVKRKVIPSEEGIRLLVIGATPGEPYSINGKR